MPELDSEQYTIGPDYVTTGRVKNTLPSPTAAKIARLDSVLTIT
jgi:hypothetical protein